MADKERLTEQSKFQTEMLRLAWLSLLAVTSGTVGLLLGELNNRRVAFAAVGTVIVASFLVYIGHLLRRIRTTIDKLSEV
jgi:uncharacterized membrane protein